MSARRVGIVTGAARGIGAAISQSLAPDLDRLILVDLSPGLAETVQVVADLGTATTPVQVDLTTSSGRAEVVEALGGDELHVLVNNAGITKDARLVNMAHDEFVSVLDVNLGAAHLLIESLRERLGEGSAIVNMASRAYLGNFGQFNYAMSKGGLVGLTRALAIELAPRCHVNAVAPGLIGTEMAMGIPEEIRQRMIDVIPMDRMGTPEEVAELVAFLASERSSYITGHVHVIGGGRSLT